MSTPAGHPDYLTDGVHLYEVLKRTRNHGLLGGEFVTAVDCQTDERRELGPREAALAYRRLLDGYEAAPVGDAGWLPDAG